MTRDAVSRTANEKLALTRISISIGWNIGTFLNRGDTVYENDPAGPFSNPRLSCHDPKILG